MGLLYRVSTGDPLSVISRIHFEHLDQDYLKELGLIGEMGMCLVSWVEQFLRVLIYLCLKGKIIWCYMKD